jgi:hypothetical protein
MKWGATTGDFDILSFVYLALLTYLCLLSCVYFDALPEPRLRSLSYLKIVLACLSCLVSPCLVMEKADHSDAAQKIVSLVMDSTPWIVKTLPQAKKMINTLVTQNCYQEVGVQQSIFRFC